MKKLIYSSLALSVLFLTLSAFNSSSPVLLPTNLKVTVLDQTGNIVQGATVALFKSESDWFEEKDPIREGQKTDAKGRTVFKKLSPAKYFIYAKKGDKDNVGEVVSTSKLREGKTNLVNVIIK